MAGEVVVVVAVAAVAGEVVAVETVAAMVYLFQNSPCGMSAEKIILPFAP